MTWGKRYFRANMFSPSLWICASSLYQHDRGSRRLLQASARFRFRQNVRSWNETGKYGISSERQEKKFGISKISRILCNNGDRPLMRLPGTPSSPFQPSQEALGY